MTAVRAALAARNTPKSAVLRVAKGFYTGSKREGVKAGAESVGREECSRGCFVAALFGPPRQTFERRAPEPNAFAR